jgi:hypothetical protein
MKYLLVPICAFNMCAAGYEVYHHPQFLLTGLHSIGHTRILFNFNQYN